MPTTKKPSFFSNLTAGSQTVSWDIGSNSVKVSLTTGFGENTQVNRLIEVANPIGLSFPEQPPQISQFQGLIGSIINEHKLPVRGVRYSLPESVVSTQVVPMPNLSDAELSSAINWQAEQYLPIAKDELVSEYQVLSRPAATQVVNDQKMQVLLVGTKRQNIDWTLEIFRGNGIELEVLENQATSLSRQLALPTSAPNTLLIQIGANLTSIFAFRQGQLFFVLNYPEAGELLTKALINNFSISKEKAEEYKKTFGLLTDQGEGKIAAALQPAINLILNNLKNALQFFANKAEQETIDRIYLTGGSAQLPGLIPYLQTNLNLSEINLLDNFNGLKGTLPEQNQSAFGVALGLAKRK